jgi:ABC-type transporter Mla MlaB component
LEERGVKAFPKSSRIFAATLVLDLKAVNRADQAGVYLLALLRQHRVRSVASGTAMAEIVRTIEKEWPGNEPESINGRAPEGKKE